MGCNSSAPAQEPTKGGSAKKAAGNKGVLQQTIKWEYFAGFGRGDPLRQMFDHAGQMHTKECPTFESWGARKAAGDGGEFGGGLPQVFVQEGGKTHRMAQFGATLRSFGIRLGYYNPKDWRQARYIDPVIDTWSDLQGALAGWAFAPPGSAQQDEALVKFLALAKKFYGLIEAAMNHHNGKYAAGDKITIADFVVASFVGNYALSNPSFPVADQFKAAMDAFPKTKTLAMQLMKDCPGFMTRTEKSPF